MTYIPLSNKRIRLVDVSPGSQSQGTGLVGFLYIVIHIPIHGGQTSNELRLQPSILPSTSHAGNLGNVQLQSRRSTCLDLTRDLVLERLSLLNLLGDLPV